MTSTPYPKKRPSFNDHVNNGDQPAAPPTMSCAAYGCPLAAGTVIDGKHYCNVHMDARHCSDGSVQAIKRYQGLVEAIAVLRSPGHRMEAQAISDACRLWPDLNPNPKSPYHLLVDAESMLRREVLSGTPAPKLPSDYGAPAAPTPDVVRQIVYSMAQDKRMDA